jgi:hypothetical protein
MMAIGSMWHGLGGNCGGLWTLVCTSANSEAIRRFGRQNAVALAEKAVVSAVKCGGITPLSLYGGSERQPSRLFLAGILSLCYLEYWCSLIRFNRIEPRRGGQARHKEEVQIFLLQTLVTH